MKSKKEEIIEILKYEARVQDTEDYTDYEIVNTDEVAERIVKLFTILVVSQQRELLKAFCKAMEYVAIIPEQVDIDIDLFLESL